MTKYKLGAKKMEKEKNFLSETSFEKLLRDCCKADAVFMYNGFIFILRDNKIRQRSLSLNGRSYILAEHLKLDRSLLESLFSEFVEKFTESIHPAERGEEKQ